MTRLTDILADIAGQDVPLPRDLAQILPQGERHPNDRPLGLLKPRGNPSGLVLVAGEERGRFGDVETPEVTFSCAKSYLSALAGIAFRDGLITDLDEPVARKVKDGGFDSPQNAPITWRHLLQQTSEWEGELFGLPDWLDRGRVVGGANGGGGDGAVGASATGLRDLQWPGSYWEYNDVRVNRLSLVLLRLFEEPLPEVLKREIMDPLGASDSWSWHGYETSRVDVNGQEIESVSGGTHWGGGLWINTLDHARFGSLYLNEGRTGANKADRQILPAEWIPETLNPCTINPGYGFLWWLNHEGSLSSVADETAFAAKGAGGHTIFVWPERDVVIVLRWCVDGTTAIDRILKAL